MANKHVIKVRMAGGVQQKHCNNCGRWLALAEHFYKNKSRPDGYNSWCADCSRRALHDYARRQCISVEAAAAKGRKTCSKCKKNKHWTKFYMSARSKDSLGSSCKLCENVARRETAHRAAARKRRRAAMEARA